MGQSAAGGKTTIGFRMEVMKEEVGVRMKVMMEEFGVRMVMMEEVMMEEVTKEAMDSALLGMTPCRQQARMAGKQCRPNLHTPRPSAFPSTTRATSRSNKPTPSETSDTAADRERRCATS